MLERDNGGDGEGGSSIRWYPQRSVRLDRHTQPSQATPAQYPLMETRSRLCIDGPSPGNQPVTMILLGEFDLEQYLRSQSPHAQEICNQELYLSVSSVEKS